MTQEWYQHYGKQQMSAQYLKKGNKFEPINYRPISLTCICCKIMEHIITSHIMCHADNNTILYDLQHGFRKKLSCETQLIECIDDIIKNLDNGQQTDCLSMDSSKASQQGQP